MYTEEETSKIYEIAERIGVLPEHIISLNLPILLIESLSDEDIINQLKVVKGIVINTNELVEDLNSEEVDSLEEQSENLITEFEDQVQDLEEDYKQKSEDVENELDSILKEEIIEEKPLMKSTKKKVNKPTEDNKKPIQKTKSQPIESDEDFLSRVKVIDVSNLQAFNNYMEHLPKNVPVYEVTLPQSGYNASVRSMTADELDKYRNSSFANAISKRKTLLDIVYNCIESTSLVNFSKKDFLSGTSALDFDILLFGIMNQTFGALKEFNVKCPHCSGEFNQKIITDTLIKVNSEEAGSEVSKIIHSTNKEDIFRNSLLKKFSKRILIPDTHLVIEYKFFNLNKEEQIQSHLGNLPNEDKMTRRYQLAYVIDTLLLPQYDKDNQYVGSVEIKSPSEIYRYLESVKSSSLNKTIEQIEEIMDKYTIKFTTPELTCHKCGEIISSFPVSIPDYFQIEIIDEF